MRRIITPTTIITALLFGVLNSLVIAVIADLAVSYWGRPRGVGYGILGYYYWIMLSIYGFTMVFVFRTISIRFALTIFLILITGSTFFLMPEQGERPILVVYAGAMIMCLGLAVWEQYRSKRRD